mmetsp:Transcript_24472/g.97081  ORF Transcript_24472/g.97081 Transcript_24472/m.97081 type:complete len:222 (-) Transcript_24472:1092-1757(-)
MSATTWMATTARCALKRSHLRRCGPGFLTVPDCSRCRVAAAAPADEQTSRGRRWPRETCSRADSRAGRPADYERPAPAPWRGARLLCCAVSAAVVAVQAASQSGQSHSASGSWASGGSRQKRWTARSQRSQRSRSASWRASASPHASQNVAASNAARDRKRRPPRMSFLYFSNSHRQCSTFLSVRPRPRSAWKSSPRRANTAGRQVASARHRRTSASSSVV